MIVRGTAWLTDLARRYDPRSRRSARGRDHWLREIGTLDPAVDYRRIYAIMYAHEFPWDMGQALGLALYRTYAVPSIGNLLLRTGEFAARPRKRYEDTGLILETILLDGFDEGPGQRALHRMNRMHAAYSISQDDMRYVLAAFVVTPVRWLSAYGWRELSEAEKLASVNYWSALGHRMGISGIPAAYAGFAAYFDAYEREHFAPSTGGRATSDATLALMATLPPASMLPAALVRRFAFCLLDDRLLDVFGYPRPGRAARFVTRVLLRARTCYLRRRPPRMNPVQFRESPVIRSYPDGWTVDDLGSPAAGGVTFPW